MIDYKKGNLFEEQTEALVNTVNCVGVMGRGIALQFKKIFPDNFKEYQKACKAGEVVPGKMFVYKTNQLINPEYIINFPTKRHWKGKSSINDIKDGLIALREDIINYNIKSMAIPPLGCGLGGLNWSDVKSLIDDILGDINDVQIIVFEPNNEDHNVQADLKKAPRMTPGRAALIELINNYLQALLDPFVSLLEIHKLMYFMQEAGEHLKLKFVKAPYGPYAENLRHVLNIIEGFYINGYDGEDNPDKEIVLLPKAADDAKNFLNNNIEVLNRFEKVAELVAGFESSFGLELLSTVHWVIKKENMKTEENVIKAVYSWNKHKKQFSEKQIKTAINRLYSTGWIEKSNI